MLKLNNLTKTYKGSEKGVHDLSLHVEPGDIYAFIGHNGAGKTTTLRCIAGIHSFDSGEIIIDGTNIKTDSLSCRKKIAYIPDNPDIYEYLTGIQYLNFIADIFGISSEERTGIIQEMAEEFEITAALGDLVSSYSHGMKQKLALISAFLHSPKLIILDEPFVGLDPKAALILKNKMHEFCSAGGSVFFSTHVLDVAEKLCNKVAIIKEGRLLVSGKMEEIASGGKSLEDIFMEVVEK